jgi:hypothetical protein
MPDCKVVVARPMAAKPGRARASARISVSSVRGFAGASVEELVGGRKVPIGWGTGGSRGCHPQLRQPLAPPDARRPDIVEAILNGRQPKGLQLEELTRVMPSTWAE